MVIVAIVLSSCNHDVFVPETVPSAMAIYLDGDGDSTDFVFSPKDIIGIRVFTGMCSAMSFDSKGSVVSNYEYNPTDGPTLRRYIDLPPEGRVIIYGNSVESLIITQTEDNKLSFVLDEFLDAIFAPRLEMELMYDDTTYNIPIDISSNSGYVVTDLTYNPADSTVEFLWERSPMSYTYRNDGDKESSAIFDAFAEMNNTIDYTFRNEVFQLTNILYHDPYIFSYPIYEDGRIQFVDEAVFGQTILPISQEYYFVELPPKTTVYCTVYVETCNLSVDAKITLENVATGRKREYRGRIKTQRLTASKANVTKVPI